MQRLDAVIALLAALLPALVPSTARAEELSEQERRGRQIYLQGTSATGAEIVALVGDARIEVPASILPCGGCHGADGHAEPRGELTPADVTWPALSSSLDSGPPNGRRRPPYTVPLLRQAITRGLDAAGNQLHVAMPRYRLTLRDAADLIAYVQRLGGDAAAGARASGSDD